MRSYYWLYYAATLFAAVAQRNPYIAFGFLFLLAVRPWLPDPVVIWRNFGRIGSLKRQVELNPANITARRDLGQAYLDLRWYGSAQRFLDEAQKRRLDRMWRGRGMMMGGGMGGRGMGGEGWGGHGRGGWGGHGGGWERFDGPRRGPGGEGGRL